MVVFKGFSGKFAVLFLLLSAVFFSGAIVIEKNFVSAAGTEDNLINSGIEEESGEEEKSNLVSVVSGPSGSISIQSEEINLEDYRIPNKIIVKFKQPAENKAFQDIVSVLDTGMKSIDKLNLKHGIVSAEKTVPVIKGIDNIGLNRIYTFYLSKDDNIDEVIKDFFLNENVEYAEAVYEDILLDDVPLPEMQVSLKKSKLSGNQKSGFPDDPFYYSFGSWGQDFYDEYWIHITHMADAWNYSDGSNIVIGYSEPFDSTHPELTGKNFVNSDEIPFNGIDDDLDGKIDNTYFSCGNEPCTDGLGNHGTLGIGIIGSSTNNGQGISGIAFNSELMYEYGFAERVDAGARIMSHSLHSASGNQWEDLTQYIYDNGGLFFFAAGNKNAYATGTGTNPAVINVGASDFYDERGYFSAWGNTLDVVAPGVNVLSLGQAGIVVAPGYAFNSGTSLSAPIAAGLGALIFSYNEFFSPGQLRYILLNSAVDLGESGWDPFFGYGRIDGKNAFDLALHNPPIENFSCYSGEKCVKAVKGNTELFQPLTLVKNEGYFLSYYARTGSLDNVRVSICSDSDVDFCGQTYLGAESCSSETLTDEWTEYSCLVQTPSSSMENSFTEDNPMLVIFSGSELDEVDFSEFVLVDKIELIPSFAPLNNILLNSDFEEETDSSEWNFFPEHSLAFVMPSWDFNSKITYPKFNQPIVYVFQDGEYNDTITVEGTAKSPDFLGYEIELCETNEMSLNFYKQDFALINCQTVISDFSGVPVENGVLGSFDAIDDIGLLPGYYYFLRLNVFDEKIPHYKPYETVFKLYKPAGIEKTFYPVHDGTLYESGETDETGNYLISSGNPSSPAQANIKFDLNGVDFSTVLSAYLRFYGAEPSTLGPAPELYSIEDYGELGIEDWNPVNKEYIANLREDGWSTSHVAENLTETPSFLIQTPFDGESFYFNSSENFLKPTLMLILNGSDSIPFFSGDISWILGFMEYREEEIPVKVENHGTMTAENLIVSVYYSLTNQEPWNLIGTKYIGGLHPAAAFRVYFKWRPIGTGIMPFIKVVVDSDNDLVAENNESTIAVMVYPCVPEDLDEDGFDTCGEDYDCVDSNPLINQSMTEKCNGFDDNCNGLKDYQENDDCFCLNHENNFCSPGLVSPEGSELNSISSPEFIPGTPEQSGYYPASPFYYCGKLGSCYTLDLSNIS